MTKRIFSTAGLVNFFSRDTGVSKDEEGNVIKDLVITIEDVNTGEKSWRIQTKRRNRKVSICFGSKRRSLEITYEAQGIRL